MLVVRPGTDRQPECIADHLRQIADAQAVQARALVIIAESVSRAEQSSPSRLYSRKEAASLLRRSTRTVDRRIAGGELLVVTHGRRVMITGDSLQKLRQPERHRAVEVMKL